MQKEKLKVGVIGFGRMGQKYGKEIINHPLLELVYICGNLNQTCNDA